MKTRRAQIFELSVQRKLAALNHKPVKPIDKVLVLKVCRQLKHEMKMERRAS